MVQSTEQLVYELTVWLDEVVKALDRILFTNPGSYLAPEESARRLLASASREFTSKPNRPRKERYSTLIKILGALSRLLDSPKTVDWKNALANVLQLRKRTREYPELGTIIEPEQLFATHMIDHVKDTGVLPECPTICDESGKHLAMELALNAGIRFLIALALNHYESLPKGQALDNDKLAKIGLSISETTE